MLPYSQLLAMIPKLRFKDDTALRSIGLAPLSKSYDAYPVSESGRKCYCLIPKGAEIPTAAKLTPMTAVKQIIVLREEIKGFAKVWPNPDSTKAEPEPAPKVEMKPAAPAKAEVPADQGPLGSLEFVDE